MTDGNRRGVRAAQAAIVEISGPASAAAIRERVGALAGIAHLTVAVR